MSQELGKTRLAVGTWVRFDYRNDLTKKQIRDFFIECLGIEIDDDRISLRSSSFVISFDRMQIASLIQWLIAEWKPNKNCIKVSLPPEGPAARPIRANDDGGRNKLWWLNGHVPEGVRVHFTNDPQSQRTGS